MFAEGQTGRMQRKSKQLPCTWEMMLVWANVAAGQKKGRKWILTME